jgi:molybdate transport system permease protein
VALLATLLSLVPAVLLGWLLARRDFPGKSVLNAVLLAPMVIPPVVTGFLLLWFVGANGPLGEVLAGAGVALPFSFAAAVLAAAVVGFPLFVITVRNAFETVDPGLEEMARTLGSTPLQAFRRVTLPLARSGIAAGMILAFARALGEFGATVVLAGNLEGETRTIALAVYTLLEAPEGQQQVWILVAASVGISFLALAGFEALSRRQRRLMRRGGHV